MFSRSYSYERLHIGRYFCTDVHLIAVFLLEDGIDLGPHELSIVPIDDEDARLCYVAPLLPPRAH